MVTTKTEAADLSRINTNPAIPPELQNFDFLPNSAHVRLPVVKALYAASGTTIWRNVKLGLIPGPTKLTPQISAWNVGALRAALKRSS